MEELNKKLKILSDFNKQAQELEHKLAEIRTEIVNLYWEIAEINESLTKDKK